MGGFSAESTLDSAEKPRDPKNEAGSQHSGSRVNIRGQVSTRDIIGWVGQDCGMSRSLQIEVQLTLTGST
jgi:hypothetical protein